MNTQLLTLLERTPVSAEDRYNITVIFSALSEERQKHILDHWEQYASRIIALREGLDAKQEKELIEALKQANTLLDQAILKEQEQAATKIRKQQQIREELESTVAYSQMRKMQKIREIAHRH